MARLVSENEPALQRAIAHDFKTATQEQMFETLACGGEVAFQKSTQRRDVVVLDISMPMLAGLEAGRRIRAAYPTMKLVYVTVHEDGELADAAFALGASAFVGIVDFTKGSH